jgi:branched-chain amino acid transport system substrate-binding protein
MKKVFAFVLAMMMVMSMFAGCQGGEAEDPNAIKIGLTGPFSGPAAVYGTAVRAGMEIAVEEINAKAEANGGLKINFRSADDEHDTETAENAYNSLKDWGMQFFAGAVTTAPSNTLAPKAVEDKIFMMTPSASAKTVPMAGESVFQMCFTDPNQGANAAALIASKALGTKIGIIYDSSDEYSTGLVQGFEQMASQLNLNIVCKEAFTDANKANLTNQVTKCKEAGADLVFLPFYATEASQVLTYAATIGYKPTFFGCDGMDGILTIDGFEASYAEGLMMMTPFSAYNTDEATKDFVEKYKKKMNGELPNQFAADGYDVIYAIYNACVALGINGQTDKAEACAKLVTFFKDYKFDGLTGTGLTWDANGMVSKTPEAVKIQNGSYVPLS